MVGRPVLVEIADVILAVLSCHVAVILEQPGDGRVVLLEPEIGSRQPHLEKACAHRRLASNERRATGCAALLPVPVGEQGASRAIRSMFRVLLPGIVEEGVTRRLVGLAEQMRALTLVEIAGGREGRVSRHRQDDARWVNQAANRATRRCRSSRFPV